MSSFFSKKPTNQDIDKIKNEIQQSAALANAQQLINNMNNKCYEKCILKPSTSLSSSEQVS